MDGKETSLALRDKRLVSFEAQDVNRIRLAWQKPTIALENAGGS